MNTNKEENTKLTDREDAHLGTRDWGKMPAGAGLENPNKGSNPEDAVKDENRAELNGKEGHFETEKLEKTDTSAVPGAESDGDIGEAASGAGLGGNKGQGTRSKKDFQ